MNGKVKWFNVRKGFGFIEGEDSVDYFVHYTALPKGIYLHENDKVTFDAVETDKGKQAQNVKVVEGGSADEAPAEEEKQEEEQKEEE
jgi:CspA family cold shock protein